MACSVDAFDAFDVFCAFQDCAAVLAFEVAFVGD
jgi:hypothetical protein